MLDKFVEIRMPTKKELEYSYFFNNHRIITAKHSVAEYLAYVRKDQIFVDEPGESVSPYGTLRKEEGRRVLLHTLPLFGESRREEYYRPTAIQLNST